MTRAVFKQGQLNNYLTLISKTHSHSFLHLSKLLGVERHTLTDWRNEKTLPDLKKLQYLSNYFDTPLPPIIETRIDSWGSSKAGFAKHQKHGCTMRTKDRAKGGQNSQIVRRNNPEYYRKLGCTVRNTFTFPDHNIKLAELVGVLLGDGHIDKNGQFTITLNSVADKKYSVYVINLINSLFNYIPSLYKRKNSKAVIVCVTGKDITDYLVKSGLKIGDKVKQQVDVPDWIKANSEFSRWCLRGLMDTDGGIFTNTYKVHGKSYVYPKTSFTNASQPLLEFVYNTLKYNGFHPNNRQSRKIWLYSQDESKRYLKLIGSSNERLLKKIR